MAKYLPWQILLPFPPFQNSRILSCYIVKKYINVIALRSNLQSIISWTNLDSIILISIHETYGALVFRNDFSHSWCTMHKTKWIANHLFIVFWILSLKKFIYGCKLRSKMLSGVLSYKVFCIKSIHTYIFFRPCCIEWTSSVKSAIKPKEKIIVRYFLNSYRIQLAQLALNRLPRLVMLLHEIEAALIASNAQH